MKLLIDTNIIIDLEHNDVIDKKFAQLYQFAKEYGCQILIHPLCINDILRDKDEERKSITLSKLEKYNRLLNPAVTPKDFIDLFKINKPNDIVDIEQLYQVNRSYVDFFITEDYGIHSKAASVNLKHKVLRVNEAVDLLNETFKIIIPKHPILKHGSSRDISKYLDTPFFDSFREDYQGFNVWFTQKCDIENRPCFYLEVNNQIKALLIYKKETAREHRILGIHDDALKICSFKVDPTAFGLKIGELFLQKMLEYCIHNSILHLYVTSFDKQIHLIELLKQYGFDKQEFKNKEGKKEIRLIRNLQKEILINSKNEIIHHPFYKDDSSINKYIIPIEPSFYNTLFKDGNLRQANLFEDQLFENEIQGNTISKAYLSFSKTKGLKPGDLLLFYSSKQYQVVEPIGILDAIQYEDDIESIMLLVSKRTVYSKEQIQKMLEKGAVTILLFRLVGYLSKPIPSKVLFNLECSKAKFVTVTRVSENDYLQLKKMGFFDERFIIN